jgi:transcriptional regulator with XRE-family HTH domain
MSVVDHSLNPDAAEKLHRHAHRHPLHRIATVRRLQCISRRTIARSLNVPETEVRRQEKETSDLPLSNLYQWQEVLQVPITELLVESDDSLSRPLMERAQLLRLMKTAKALLESVSQDATRLMAQTLVDELVEIMPELEGVGAWHTVGKRRSLDELGVAAMRTPSGGISRDLSE